jgi:hypothetical protein
MPTPEQIEAARKAAPPFWRDTANCEKHIAKMLTAAEAKPRVKVKPLVVDFNEPLNGNGIDRLRLWLSDPDTFPPIDLDDAEEILSALEDQS